MYMSLFLRLCICVCVSTSNASDARARGLVGCWFNVEQPSRHFSCPPPPRLISVNVETGDLVCAL